MPRTFEINPDRLIVLLKRDPRSQKQLAEEIGTDVGTLSRWKRGKIRKLRSNALAKLCKALGTTPTELCADGPLPDALDNDGAKNKGQVTMMLDTACRNSLALVARRYGVTRQQIVEVAPLLFLIMAEQSLVERRRQLKEHRVALCEFESSAPRHLRKWLHAPDDMEDQGLLDAEDRSIDKRDLFATRVGRWDEDHCEDNPFARFLREKLSETGLPHGKTVAWEEADSPSYMIGIDELKELIGTDEEALVLVLYGKVALAEMPGDIRRATPETRATWLKQKAALNAKELRDALKKNDFDNPAADIEPQIAEAIEQSKYDF